MSEELNACPFCKQTRVMVIVDQEEWDAARVSCRAHRCGALGPWVDLAAYETVSEARSAAIELWNAAA